MNRLQHETSPYLLQHATNPVDWYPWGAEALERAQAEDKPILLSIGYSACHWCHVMEHESFEDSATADVMNQHFINIKVDREERPDLDDIYMRATQIFNQGHGGWPMTVFLTPSGKPFHAGTYYPKEPRYGMPSFQQIMLAVLDAYQKRRSEVDNAAGELTQMLQSEPLKLSNLDGGINAALLDQAAQHFINSADMTHGGLHRGAPKFPNPMNLDFLLRYAAATDDRAALNLACFTLERMARGGMYDQLGGGFHRYSVDEHWLVPHFEKMLYDNAQLARVYLHAYQLTQDDFFAGVTRQILAYVSREMRDPNGGFYSAQDADSEGHEGKFFVWTPETFKAALSDHFTDEVISALMAVWDVTEGGNFEGDSILHLEQWPQDIAHEHNLSGEQLLAYVEQARGILFTEREKRIKPARDEKQLAAWNGMMLAAYAEAARVLDEAEYLDIARENAEFIQRELITDEGRLYRSHKDGQSKLNAYLEDYTQVIDGFLALYQTTFEAKWFNEAQKLSEFVLAHFQSDDGGGLYDTSNDHESLVARPRSLQDNAVPSGNNQMAYNLIRLAAYTGEKRYEDVALGIYQQLLAAVRQYPQAFGMALIGMDLLARRAIEVAIIGDPSEAATRELLDGLTKPFLPRVLLALAAEDQGEESSPPLLAHRSKRNHAPTVYVCQNFTCAAPVNKVEDVQDLLKTNGVNFMGYRT